jgi:hypothetical protein
MKMNKKKTFHELKEFSNSNLCHPLKCNLTTLFWYILKTINILGENEINIILSFIHSEYFKIEDTPKSYKHLKLFEPKFNKGNIILYYIILYYIILYYIVLFYFICNNYR